MYRNNPVPARRVLTVTGDSHFDHEKPSDARAVYYGLIGKGERSFCELAASRSATKMRDRKRHRGAARLQVTDDSDILELLKNNA